MRRARSWKTLVSHMRLPLLPLTDHLTRQSNMQDYEGELALVIDKKCRDVVMNKALEYVGGYFVLDDISARDVQFIDKQYSRAKSFDSFGPCGPWIVTPR
jgi:2-keto-4-pentenoate hydratase/2-oxohepta-3-ene-1,7-dioic acid hydratase in catechol pathway